MFLYKEDGSSRADVNYIKEDGVFGLSGVGVEPGASHLLSMPSTLSWGLARKSSFIYCFQQGWLLELKTPLLLSSFLCVVYSYPVIQTSSNSFAIVSPPTQSFNAELLTLNL